MDLNSAKEHWTPPQILGERSWRKIIFTDYARGIVTTLVGVILVTLIPASYTYFWAAREHERFALLHRDGLQVQGTVTAKNQSNDRKRWLTISYAYQVDGRVFKKIDYVTQDEYERTQNNQPISVLYLPARPTVTWLEIKHEPQILYFMFVFPIFFFCLGVFLLKRSIRHKDLLGQGVPTAGLVEKIEIDQVRYQSKDHGMTAKITYSYLDETGKSHRGSSLTPFSSSMKVGGVATVLYFSEAPHESLVYPSAFVRFGE